MGNIRAILAEALQPGVLGKREKESSAFGIALARQCRDCIALHIRGCKQAGVTLQEMMDVCGIAIMMGGGPVLTHMAGAERVLNEFCLDADGNPI